jgi:hypothetical protein
VKYAALSRTAHTPLADYDYEYLYPSDCLRLLRPDMDEYPWEVGIRGNDQVIWSDDDSPLFKYIFRNTNVNQYSPWLAWALQCRIAAVVAQALTQHRGKAQDRMLFYENEVRKAKAMDGQEQAPAVFISTALTDDVRLGG